MNKPPSFFYIYILFLVILGITFAPSSTSADVISILSSVFRNSSVGELQEIEQVHVKNIQTMPILTASTNPEDATSTIETIKVFKTTTSVVEGKAFTNENSSVEEGVFTGIPKDIASSDRISLYTVRKNDTLEQIADMYGVTPNTILWANDLKKGTVLSPDQVLVILPISSIKYAVKKGDSLQSLAKKFNGDESEIAQFNNLESGAKLAVGSEIMIPDADGALLAEENKKAEDEDKKKKAAAKKNSKAAILIGTSARAYTDTSGYFARPVASGIRTQGLHGNNGVDFASSQGTPILAAASGQVIISKAGGWGGGYGTYVVIKHGNGTQTLYGHLSQTNVSAGQTVTKGQQIGKMGNTGQSTGVHLHFEVRGGKNPF